MYAWLQDGRACMHECPGMHGYWCQDYKRTCKCECHKFYGYSVPQPRAQV